MSADDLKMVRLEFYHCQGQIILQGWIANKLMLLWRFLQIWSFFWNNRVLHWADLQANATVYAGGKVNPVPVITLNVFTRARVNASYRASIYAISNAFANISNNRMWHGFVFSDSLANLLGRPSLAYQ